MSKLTSYKLGDISSIIGGGTPSTLIEEYWNGNIPWLTPRDLTNYTNKHISRGERNITELGLKNSSSRLLPKGSVLLTSRAPIGYLAIAANELCTNQGFKSFIVDETKVNSEFLYYLLLNNVDNLKALGTGTTFAEVSATILKNVEFQFPENLSEQEQIVTILSSLDDKIQINLEINQTIETMAQAVFKDWFVNFNFPGFDDELVDGLPKGWRLDKLKEILEIRYGKDYKHLESGNIPLYGSGGIMKYVNKSLYENDSILIPRKGTLSNLFYTNKPFWSVDTMFYTKFKNELSGKYLFYLLKTMDLASMNVGSAVPSLTTQVLNNLLIVIPSNEILKQFEELITTMYEKMELNIAENQTLTQIRDSLLPKLMTGQIEIK